MRVVLALVALAVLPVLVLSGCAETKQARKVEQSGFLADLYPLMSKGRDDESLYVYRNPKAAQIPKGTYTKFMLDPVLLYRGAKGKEEGASQKDAQMIADTFYALIYQELSKDYEIVTAPDKGALRGQVAITHMEESWVALDVISSVPAPLNVFAASSLVKTLATGKPAFTGEVSIEWKISDAQSGEVLSAGVDRRVGKKRLGAGSLSSWQDVYSAEKYWAQLARYRLCLNRGQRTDCPKPEDGD